MKKALVYSPYWDTLGGGERYTASFIELLLSADWHVDLVWPTSISESIKDRFNLEISGANYISSHSPLTSLGYDLSFYVSDGSLPISLSRKSIVHFQFPFTNVGGQSVFNRFKSNRLTFVSNSIFTKSFVDPEFSVTSKVIYPPVQTHLFKPLKKTQTILYVGRFSHLTQAKNPHLLIEAFRLLYQNQPSWRLILAGGAGVGTSEGDIAHLHDLSKDLPVEILTNPTLNQLYQLYGEASLFWSASGLGINEKSDPLKVEHFGMSVVEAMSAGCIPLLSNLGGHKEIVNHQIDGILYDDLTSLVSETQKIISHPTVAAKISKAAIQKSKMFDIEVFKANFIQLL